MQKQYTDALRENIPKLLHYQVHAKAAIKRQQAAAAAGTASGNGIATNAIATASPRDASPSPYTTANPHLKTSSMQQPARPYPHQGYDGQAMHAAYDSSTTNAANRPHATPTPQMRGSQQQQNMHGTSHSHQQYMMYQTMNRPERCAPPILHSCDASSSRSPRVGPNPLSPTHTRIHSCIYQFTPGCLRSPGMGGHVCIL